MSKAWIRVPPPRVCMRTRFSNAGAHGAVDTAGVCTGTANERQVQILARMATEIRSADRYVYYSPRMQREVGVSHGVVSIQHVLKLHGYDASSTTSWRKFTRYSERHEQEPDELEDAALWSTLCSCVSTQIDCIHLPTHLHTSTADALLLRTSFRGTMLQFEVVERTVALTCASGDVYYTHVALYPSCRLSF